MKFNTAIATLMSLANDIYNQNEISFEYLRTFVKLLSPFAPHLCEEIYSRIDGEGLCSVSSWPEYDENKIVDDSITIGVQVNGKMRETITIPVDASEEQALECANANEKLQSFLLGKTIVKVIYVKNRILNFIVK